MFYKRTQPSGTTGTNMAACFVWDATIYCDKWEFDELKTWMTTNCKQWAFQKEECPTTKNLHWQCRFSLKEKLRHNGVWNLFAKGVALDAITPTSNENKTNMFYVIKNHTRVEGPWTDADKVTYIPKQVKGIELRKWQQSIVDKAKVWDTRTINIILDEKGNIGKSTLITYCGVHELAKKIPLANDYKDILRMVHCMPKLGAYFIDMPRAIKKEKLYQFWSAIETIKDGYCYDDRYEFKDEYFDCPNIFVFTNTIPELSLLTRDRWVFWKIEHDELKPYTDIEKDEAYELE